VLSSFGGLRDIACMKSAAQIVFSLYYLAMTVGFTVGTCVCWSPFDRSDQTSREQVASACCAGGCSQSCCLKEASPVQLSDDHTSAEPLVSAQHKHLSTFAELKYPSASYSVAGFECPDTGSPQRNALIQILDCSFLL
jgi:hypothetical protein